MDHIVHPDVLRKVSKLRKYFTKQELGDLSVANCGLVARAFHSDRPLWVEDDAGRCLLHECARRGMLEAATKIINQDPYTVYLKDKRGRTPVHEAILSKDIPTATLMCATHVMSECDYAFELAVSEYIRDMEHGEEMVWLVASSNLWTNDSLLAVVAYCHCSENWDMYMLFGRLRRNMNFSAEEDM